MESMIAPIGRRYHSKETLEEIRDVFLAELDYRIEAETTEIFRKIHADYPAIVIPRVHHALTTRRVLVNELVLGEDYATFAARAGQEEKNLASVTIWRFMFRALFVHGVLYADPHPGNYRFLGGDRVAFLDFGCRKVLPPDFVAGMKRYAVAAMDEDWPEFYKACAEVLGYDPSDEAAWHLYTEYTKLLLLPLTQHGTYKHTREAARETIAFLVRGGKEIWKKKDDEIIPDLPKPIDVPRDFTFISRLQWGLASVMGGLGGEGEYRKITEPWVRGPVLPIPT
jgi:hypothetical protein